MNFNCIPFVALIHFAHETFFAHRAAVLCDGTTDLPLFERSAGTQAVYVVAMR